MAVAKCSRVKNGDSGVVSKNRSIAGSSIRVAARAPIGKDTVHAIQSGVLRGYVGLVRHMVQEIRLEAGSHYLAVATGVSSILHPLRDVFEEINPNLTLDGLLRISELADLNGPES